MSYRNDVDALASRHAALDAEVTRVRRERDAARTLLESAQARLRLPVLDNIRVAAPCAEDWNGMQGDAQVRHCARCDQNVYNLSEMTREEAEALLVEREGKLCVRYFRRKQDGTILTRNCPVGAQRRRRWMFGVGFVVTVVGTVFGFLSGRKGTSTSVETTAGMLTVHDQEMYQGGSGAGPSYETAPATPPATK